MIAALVVGQLEYGALVAVEPVADAHCVLSLMLVVGEFGTVHAIHAFDFTRGCAGRRGYHVQHHAVRI
jgi:hypothetical protein